MNIAFTTILIFLILAPGFLARIAYNSSKLSINNPTKNIVNELTFSIIPALIFQIIFIILVNNFTNYLIDFSLLGNLILGVTNNGKVGEWFGQIEAFKYQIFFYHIILFLFAFIIGYSTREFIRYFGLDKKFRYLRFSNKWHYIFSGECLDFPDVPDDYDEITHKIINVLCKVNGNSILYSGEFFNYYVDKDGNLEAVHLKYPIRRMLDKDDDTELNRYYHIASRYLVIPNSDIININFRYLSLEILNEDDLTPEIRREAMENSSELQITDDVD